MNRQEIEARKQTVIEKYGAWTSNNIHIAHGVYTMGERVIGDEIRARRVVQIIADLVNKPLDTLRILDLGSFEGLYAIELARHGAKVVGIEARQRHIEKARFVAEAAGISNVTFVQGDVRDLRKVVEGTFDVLLCLGILYHINEPDVFVFAEEMAAVCEHLLLIDTHISLSKRISVAYKNRIYHGLNFIEHMPDSSDQERRDNTWASIDNVASFWLTRPSLYNLLADLGFTSVYQCEMPYVGYPIDRILVTAVKGKQRETLASPLLDAQPSRRMPEVSSLKAHSAQKWHHPYQFWLKNWLLRLGRPVKRLFKRFLGH